MSINDEQLMNEYKKGQEEAFNTLYERYSGLVFSYCRKRLHSSDVEDFYQSIWRHLHEKRESYHDQPFAPWFFILIRNLLIDEYRSKGRQKKLIDTIQIPDLENNTEGIHDLLSRLPEQTASLIRKYYLDGFDYEDLEKEMGVSQIGLRKRLSRGIKELREKFEV